MSLPKSLKFEINCRYNQKWSEMIKDSKGQLEIERDSKVLSQIARESKRKPEIAFDEQIY